MPQQQIAPALVPAFAPDGTLRASINLGNPILAQRGPDGGDPVGVSVDLAYAFGRRLGVPVELVVFEKAAASVEAVKAEKADLGFFAVDPARSEGLLFTAPYVLIEGSHLVRESSTLAGNGEVDVEGTRISVGSGSAYDLFLTRAIEAAEIVRLQGARPPRSPPCGRVRSKWPPGYASCWRERPGALPAYGCCRGASW
ncbi:transporter substrate-binding domain-containing protein [Streptomyces cyaneofuscatus]|uniref:transporter substrate-binding domain-containing protein n=1 Tax=Streptomyces cyaneofuscatus TaxID=66883 RepID=UPI0033F92F9F